MTDIRVPDLPLAGPLDGTELVFIIQNGDCVLTTVSAIRAAANTGYLVFAVGAGLNSNPVIAGFGPTINRIDITLSGGDAQLGGFPAGTDSQTLTLRNADANHVLDLIVNGTTFSAQFFGPLDAVELQPGQSIQIKYYTILGAWVIVN